MESAWKVFIIPDADRLTDQAANALLKSLEEPQAGRMFILGVTSPTRLVATVLSRCQLERFAPVSQEALANWLLSQGTDEQRARIIAGLSHGRPGIAAQLLSNQDLWLHREAVLGGAKDLAYANPSQAVEIADRLEGAAVQIAAGRKGLEETLDVLATWFRDLLMLKQGQGASAVLNQDHDPQLDTAAQRYTAPELLHALTAIHEARQHLAANANVKLLLTRLALRLCVRDA